MRLDNMLLAPFRALVAVLSVHRHRPPLHTIWDLFIPPSFLILNSSRKCLMRWIEVELRIHQLLKGRPLKFENDSIHGAYSISF